jgi:hypothetical protein
MVEFVFEIKKDWRYALSNTGDRIGTPRKKRLFVSYHHDRDRHFFERLSRLFAARYDITEDASRERTTGSDDGERMVEMLRKKFVARSDCSILLCGLQTPFRKFVDWEIKAALDESKGMVGVNLPTNHSGPGGRCVVPDRFSDNIRSQFAVLISWEDIVADPELLAREIEEAMSRPVHLIRNARPLRRKGG